MYSLNIASAEAAEKLNEAISIDFYLTVTFKSGLYYTEWGEMEVCEIRFGGEGSVAEDNMERGSDIIRSVMAHDCPELNLLFDIVKNNFGSVDLSLDFPEY